MCQRVWRRRCGHGQRLINPNSVFGITAVLEFIIVRKERIGKNTKSDSLKLFTVPKKAKINNKFIQTPPKHPLKNLIYRGTIYIIAFTAFVHPIFYEKGLKNMSGTSIKVFSVNEPMNDPVNHPAHYTTGKIEVIDYIEDQKLPYHLGNAVKYISRAGKKDKDKTVEDLKKAVWYIQRYIGLISRGNYTDTTTVDDADSTTDTADRANDSNNSDAADEQCISPTLSEDLINTEIFIDFDSELIYGEDQVVSQKS